LFQVSCKHGKRLLNINSILGKDGLEKGLGDVCLADEIKVFI
jgi:hypothetical protein